jgi:hypothetical protein
MLRVARTKCQSKAITPQLGLIERLTKNDDSVCTGEKVKKKKTSEYA